LAAALAFAASLTNPADGKSIAVVSPVQLAGEYDLDRIIQDIVMLSI